MDRCFRTKPLRVLFICDLGTEPLSGPQRFARAFANAMAGGVDFNLVNISEGNKLSRSLACLRGYDIYHVSGVSFLEPVLSALRSCRNLVYTAHGMLAQEAKMGYRYPGRMLWAEGFLLRRARVMVTVSEALSQRITAKYPFAAGKTRIIPPAVDPAILETAPENPGFPRPYILFPGSGPTKGLARALAVFGLLRGELPDLNMVVISDTHGPDLPGVIWSKPLPTPFLAGAYLRSELVLNTSDYETFGLPIVEAAALGKPFLVSAGSGVSEWARERFPDMIVDPRDHESLAEKIKAILESPPSPESLKSWVGSFSPRRIVDEYLALYREICPT